VRARALLAALAFERVVAAKELLAKRGEPGITAGGLGNAHTRYLAAGRNDVGGGLLPKAET
jgi:hypothetical protein